jgi:hypothetical protein
MKHKPKKRQVARHRKKNAKNLFIRGFLQSFFIVAILLTAGVIGYRTTMNLWMVEKQKPVVAEVPEPTPVPITTASIDDISKNLIFCYDRDTNTIGKLVLEVFHCEKKQLIYITIPMNTRFTMSDTLYKKIILYQPSIPQIISLSTITNYLEEAVVFDCIALMAEDLLGINISYYTVMPVELYQTVFEEKDIISGVTAKSLMSQDKGVPKRDQEEEVLEAEVFTKEYLKFLGTLDDKEEIRDYIEKVYTDLTSNLSVFDRMNYLDSYAETALSGVTFTRIAGENNNSGFAVNLSDAIRQLNELEAYSEAN